MPDVKKVNKFKRSYPSLISFDKDVSFKPIDKRNSCFSFRFSIREISDSISAEIFNTFVDVSFAIFYTCLLSSFPVMIESSSTLQT